VRLTLTTMSEGRWYKSGQFCKWCGCEIRVWVSDWDNSGELPENDYCSLMCQLEHVNFVLMHR